MLYHILQSCILTSAEAERIFIFADKLVSYTPPLSQIHFTTAMGPPGLKDLLKWQER